MHLKTGSEDPPKGNNVALREIMAAFLTYVKGFKRPKATDLPLPSRLNEARFLCTICVSTAILIFNK
jgi:hypothetical protein